MKTFFNLLLAVLFISLVTSCSKKEINNCDNILITATLGSSNPHPPVADGSEAANAMTQLHEENNSEFPYYNKEAIQITVDVENLDEGIFREYTVKLGVSNSDALIIKRLESTSNSQIITIGYEDVEGDINDLIGKKVFGRILMKVSNSQLECATHPESTKTTFKTDIITTFGNDDRLWCENAEPEIKANLNYSDTELKVTYTLEDYPRHYPITIKHNLRMLNNPNTINQPETFEIFGNYAVKTYDISYFDESLESFSEHNLFGTISASISERSGIYIKGCEEEYEDYETEFDVIQ